MPKIKNQAPLDTGVNVDSIDCSIQTFGSFLRSVRKAMHISLRDFEAKVRKTRAYLSDIECGKSKPPDKELLDLMIQQLGMDEHFMIASRLYDLAAVERNSVPDDLKIWIMEDPSHRNLVRKCRDKKLTSAQVDGLLKIVEDM